MCAHNCRLPLLSLDCFITFGGIVFAFSLCDRRLYGQISGVGKIFVISQHVRDAEGGFLLCARSDGFAHLIWPGDDIVASCKVSNTPWASGERGAFVRHRAGDLASFDSGSPERCFEMGVCAAWGRKPARRFPPCKQGDRQAGALCANDYRAEVAMHRQRSAEHGSLCLSLLRACRSIVSLFAHIALRSIPDLWCQHCHLVRQLASL